jgi:hypothetical protein
VFKVAIVPTLKREEEGSVAKVEEVVATGAYKLCRSQMLLLILATRD